MTRAAGLVAVLAACGDGAVPTERDVVERDPTLDDVELTSAAEAASHHAGENCLACHGPNGDGPGRFTVGGTYWRGAASGDGVVPTTPHQGLAGARLQLRTEPFGGGDLLLELVTDASGSAYTTEPFDFYEGAGAFATVVAPDGERRIGMPWPPGSGACNVCHAEDSAKMIALE